MSPVTLTDLFAALPELVLTGVGLLLLIADFVSRREGRGWVGYLGLLGLLLTFGTLLPLWGTSRVAWSGLYVSDPFALFFKSVFLLAAALTILMSIGYLREEGADRGEFYALVLFSTVGMMVMASSRDLLLLYIGLETMSLSFYVLVGFLKRDQLSNEAALKYLLMGGFSSAVLLYGIVLLYGLTSSTNLVEISRGLAGKDASDPVLILATVLLAAGFGFKIAAVPFHMYIPDVYEGAPTSVTAFLSVGPKVAGFAILLRVFLVALPALQADWTLLLMVLSVLTMTVANVIALAQGNIKRMLAYSSIAHVGYLLIGVVAGKEIGISAVLLYGFVYALMNLGAFGVVILLRQGTVRGERIDDFAGLARRSPAAAATMLIFLLSLTGIPPTAGFVGKLYLFGAAIQTGYVWLAVVAVLNSVISLVYYMKVVVAMYMREPPAGGIALSRSPSLYAALTVALVGTLVVGLYPGPLVELARASLQGLFGPIR